MKQRTIAILTDASKDIGFGHLRRSNSLAEYLQKKFVCRVYSHRAASNLLATDVDLVIFDTPSDQSKLVAYFRQKGVKTMGLDTCYDTPPDITLSIFEHRLEQKGNREAGFQFIIIREEILKLRRKETRTYNRALILLGGGDLNNQSDFVANKLLQYGYSVTLVLGPLAKVDRIRKHNRLRHFHHPDNLPELMSDCDIAVTNGGGCLFEMLYLGKATYILPQTDEEEKVANYVSKNTRILGVGLEELHKLEKLWRREAESTDNCLVSGRGLENIEMRIIELLSD